MRGVLEKVSLPKISEAHHGTEGESINTHSHMNEGTSATFAAAVAMAPLSLGIANV
jgi:hypothetical protein